MIDFEIPREIVNLRNRTREFIAEEIVPFERDERQGSHGPNEQLVEELQALARGAGLFSPHIAKEYGGLGLDHRGRAVIFEEAGYSTLGSLALNVSAPDEGTAHLLEVVATPEQKAMWLAPHAIGELRTCFAMSEPPPGAGSDPRALSTTATRDGDGWRINGVKKWITGARGAEVCIVMARHPDVESSSPIATMFMVPMNTPGITIIEDLETLDSHFVGGHSVLNFDDVYVSPDQVLGEVGKGFVYAQVRLAPARLTHCMRHLGGARRAHDLATQYVSEREGFGRRLIEHEGVSFQLANNEMELRTSRLLIWHTAWLLDRGEQARVESSQTKVAVSEAVGRIVDRSVQVMGGRGMSSETVAAQIYRDSRPFRIYDGPSEVHRWSLGKHIARRGAPVPTD